MKDLELKLVSELMKNSRRSDRELAKAIRSSQPTVTRTRRKLEKEAYIGEYTMIPNFAKLGFGIVALTFVKLKQSLNQNIDDIRKQVFERLDTIPLQVTMLERGIGLGFNGVIVSVHEDYASFAKLRMWLQNLDFLDVSETESFLINLADEIHYRPLTFATLAEHLKSRSNRQE